MAAMEILERNEQADIAVEEISPSIARDVEDALEEAELAREKEQPEIRQWYYQVGGAGVRYYSFR